jgi:PBP1b-binding outer membrane lipoprotein LpoB
MFKKIAIIGISALLLGGCTLTDIFKTNNAAKDSKSSSVAPGSPSPTSSPDASLEAMPSTSTSSDVSSLETDISNTIILDEDFSDLN